MGADIGHHASQWRPSHQVPLPESVQLSPAQSWSYLAHSICPGELISKALGPNGRNDEPFSKIRAGHPFDVFTAQESLDRLPSFDGHDDVFVITAHDFTLLPVLDFYPKDANEWHVKGWKEQNRWMFLEQLTDVVEKVMKDESSTGEL